MLGNKFVIKKIKLYSDFDKKISIIIPTLLRNEKLLLKLLETLNSDNAVGEIIVIDNTTKGFTCPYEKVRVILPKENLFVNPSWNLGIKEAKYDYFGILNDDILLSKDFCTNLLLFLSKKKGLLGIDNNIVVDIPKGSDDYSIPESSTIKLIKTTKKEFNFGIAMFGHKKSYFEIPEKMLIWAGDDYLFYKNKKSNKVNYIISNVEIKHQHSLASSEDKFNDIKINDLHYFNDKYFSNKSILEIIFSIKNEYLVKRRKRKIITLLGFKIKLRAKNL